MHSRNSSRTSYVFRAAAALTLAHQVAGKAVRDGLFLAQFPATDLPKAVIAAAVLSVLLGLAFTRSLPRYGPMRLVPRALAAGALLHVAEFLMLRFGGAAARGPVIVLVYLHLAGFGAILLSGFWSVAGEAFDPREAKREFGRIAGVGTAGGVLGGVIAERFAAWWGGDTLLVLLGALHMGAALALSRAGAAHPSATEPADNVSAWRGAHEAFRRAPFLINLAALVLIGTVSATLLDYVFKSAAAAAYGKGAQLTRYFAFFYTASQLLAFLSQTFAAPVALRRLGLGRTMRWHSGAMVLGAGASMVFPTMVMAPLVRALEAALRGSFFRSSYELFFTPLPPREKRATKMLIDVSCERMGDAVGAILLSVLLALGAGPSLIPMIALAMLLGAIAFWLTRRMDAAYSTALERGLVSRAIAVGDSDVQDSTTLAVLLHTTVPGAGKRTAPTALPMPQHRTTDTLLFRLGELRSGVPSRIRDALSPEQPYDPALAPAAVRLLAWDQTMEWARAFLLRHAHRIVGQLVDVMLDADQDVAIRRKIPHILAYTTSQRAVDGLTSALADPHFEVRFHAGRALEFLRKMGDDLRFDRAVLMDAVERELATSSSVRQDRTLLERGVPFERESGLPDEIAPQRRDKSLEYVFSLLAAILPIEPLKAAFRALYSEDRMLSALGLEFLESHLSAELVGKLRETRA